MKYNNIFKGVFKERPNRFIARVTVDGEEKICHVKNTGRCRELLLPDADVILQKFDTGTRKTEYDLIAVYKNGMLINIDTQAPNKVFGEWVKDSGFFGGLTLVRPECTFKNSRFDFYLETSEKKIFVEVKGVTLEQDGVARFPDAPTERGVKHLQELARCMEEGFEAYVLFVIQMKEIRCFSPNDETHPAFGEALRAAAARGVHVLAMDCTVTPDTLRISDAVRVEL